MAATLWVISVLLILAGLAGVLLPILPGIPLIFAGVLIAAWINDFQIISLPTVYVLAALAVLGVIIDHVAPALSVKRAGASRQGVIGAVIGTVAGIFAGVWGLVFMPLAGAAIGEFLARKDILLAGKIGVATWIGLIAAAAAKSAIAFAMVGVFIAALLI